MVKFKKKQLWPIYTQYYVLYIVFYHAAVMTVSLDRYEEEEQQQQASLTVGTVAGASVGLFIAAVILVTVFVIGMVIFTKRIGNLNSRIKQA